MATLLWITLVAMLCGVGAALALAVRREERAVLLALLFGAGATRQTAALFADAPGQLGFDLATTEETAMLIVALCGLASLAALARTARERDRVEDQHWDAMETVRAVTHVGLGAPGGEPLAPLLDIGCQHFGLPLGFVVRAGEHRPAAIRAAKAAGPDPDAVCREFAEPLARAARSDPPILDDAPLGPEAIGGVTRFFGTAIRRDGAPLGVLAFVGRETAGRVLTATEKDLLSLLAVRAGVALAPAEPAAQPASSGRSLEERVRERLGSQRVELDLGPELRMARTARIPLERLAYSLAWGARRLSPDGALYVESGTLVPPAGRGKGWITLAVRIDDPSLDAGTLARVFEPEAAPPGALALEALRRRLRSEDGDLSISVESGVGAVLTAFLPRRGRRPARRRSAPRVSPRTVG